MVYKNTHIDKVVSRELEIYIENSSNLNRQMVFPITLALARRMVNKTYNAELSVKAYENLVIEGIRQYSREYGKITANPITRNYTAKQLKENYLDEVKEVAKRMSDLKKAGKPWSLMSR
jgi:hypothetical protein